MLLTLLPAGWGFSGWPILLQLVSFPMAFGIALAVIALILGIRAGRWPGRHRWVRLIAAALIAIVGVTQICTVVWRGWWSPGSTPQPGDVTVVSFNAAGIEPLPTELLGLITTYRPQVVSLPETTRDMADRLAGSARESGLDYQVFSAPTLSSPPSMTSLLVARSFGAYRIDRTVSLTRGVVRVTPETGSGPVIVAVHPTSPAVIGIHASSWRNAGRTAVEQCTDTPGAIVAGDFNANLAHPQFDALGRCGDAAAAVRRSGEGTWPAWVPAPFASAIDHVLVDSDSWQVIDFSTRQVGQSDHRLVRATIRALPNRS